MMKKYAFCINVENYKHNLFKNEKMNTKYILITQVQKSNRFDIMFTNTSKVIKHKRILPNHPYKPYHNH